MPTVYEPSTWVTWTSSNTITTAELWPLWADSTGATTTTFTTTWGSWNVARQYAVLDDRCTMRQLSDEELTAERQRAIVEHERRVAARAAQQVQLDAARERAELLLLSCLDDEQRAELAQLDQFHVIGSHGRRYCLRRGRAHNVFEVDAEGRRRIEFCRHVAEGVPVSDNLLAQKLALETDENDYRRRANSRRLVPT